MGYTQWVNLKKKNLHCVLYVGGVVPSECLESVKIKSFNGMRRDFFFGNLVNWMYNRYSKFADV